MSIDNEKLARYGKKCIMKVVKDTLDYLEVILPEEQFQLVRKRILRSGNNEVRSFEDIVTNKYEVRYIPQINEEIRFNRKK